MSSLNTFQLFPNLPNEIQFQVWHAYILDYNNGRLITVDESTRRVILTPLLACPALSVNVISRVAAKEIYPVQFPVFYVHRKDRYRKYSISKKTNRGESDDETQLDEDDCEERDNQFEIEDGTKSDFLICGTLHISFEIDTFLIKGVGLNFDDLAIYYEELPSLCWTSPLTSDQCKLIKKISLSSPSNINSKTAGFSLEFQVVDQAEYFEHGHSLLPVEDIAKVNHHYYEKTLFRNVKSCQHFYLDVSHLNGEDDIAWDARTMPRSALLKKWRWATHYFNSKALEKKPKKPNGYPNSLS
ncbi:hypothetical protein F4779DRAFT_620798 [Xylariaceae sp. FL0662B]|nr:hypothetical protein F4779DRAFT_620798 [Xylariaceae sp. FL0662B]